MRILSAPPQQLATDPAHADPDRLATRRFLSTVVGGTPVGPRPYRAATQVRDVMHSGVVAAHEEAAYKEIVDAIIRNRVSAVPVLDHHRRVVGVVSESDLLSRVAGNHLAPPSDHLFNTHVARQRTLRGIIARDLMTAPAITTTPETTVESAAHLCARHNVRRLPVVDDEHVLLGIVTRADLLRVFLRPDEDIRVEVCDELGRIVPSADTAAVNVAVAEGVVTLVGEVEHRALAEAITRYVRSVSGVIAVDNSQLSYRFDRRFHVSARG